MKLSSLRSRFALLCALLVALSLMLFAALSSGLYYREQLDAFSEDHTRVPSKFQRREAFEGLMTLLACDAVLLPAAVAVAAATRQTAHLMQIGPVILGMDTDDPDASAIYPFRRRAPELSKGRADIAEPQAGRQRSRAHQTSSRPGGF